MDETTKMVNEVKEVMTLIQTRGVIAAREHNPDALVAALVMVSSFEAAMNEITKEEFLEAASNYFDQMNAANARMLGNMN